jgi:hypothetical protein
MANFEDGDVYYSSADEQYDSDEPAELDLNLENLKETASAAISAQCTGIRKLTRGRRHEIFLLDFSCGKISSCIARVTRAAEDLAKAQSEIDTIRFLRSHTSIPIPEIFHICLDPLNSVGAPFVLMERKPGRHLYKIWSSLTLEQKKIAICDISRVVAQLGSLEFDSIGSLRARSDGSVDVDELVHQGYTAGRSFPRGPFASTAEYLESFIQMVRGILPDSQLDELDAIQEHVTTYLREREDHHRDSSLRRPYGLMHTDFDGQNMLFVLRDGVTPELTGVIDWEYAHTAPRYYIYDYPIFIQDNSYEKEAWSDNAILRRHFVQGVLQHSTASAARAARFSFRNKCFLLNRFVSVFMLLNDIEGGMVQNLVQFYLKDLKCGTGNAYEGRQDYQPNELELGED